MGVMIGDKYLGNVPETLSRLIKDVEELKRFVEAESGNLITIESDLDQPTIAVSLDAASVEKVYDFSKECLLVITNGDDRYLLRRTKKVSNIVNFSVVGL